MIQLSEITHDYFGHDDSFASFTEMKLDRVYKECANRRKAERALDDSNNSLANKAISKPRKLNIKTVF